MTPANTTSAKADVCGLFHIKTFSNEQIYTQQTKKWLQ